MFLVICNLGISKNENTDTKIRYNRICIVCSYLTNEYLDEVYEEQVDTPYNDVVFGLVIFGVTVFFFLAIVRQRRRKIQLGD